MKTVIIGGVAGGATAAARLRRLKEKEEIIILEKGGYVSFANCGLPYYIGGEITDKEELTLQTPESFKARFNIEVRIFNEAVRVDTLNKTVLVKDLLLNEEYLESYDSLILSPGALPVKPKIKGIDSENVFTLRNIPDTFKIKEFIEAKGCKTALIAGGGYIGLEMAENLKNSGLKVALAQRSSHLMPPLDEDLAAAVHKYIKKQGIDLYLNNSLKEIRGKEVILEKGSLEADVVIIAAGVRPETDFLRDSQIELNEIGAIKVDRFTKTNIKDVYAVGDGAQAESFVTKEAAFIPLAGPANKQGRIAADNIAGIESAYEGSQGSSILKLFQMAIATTGINEKQAKERKINYDKAYLYSAPHATYYPGGQNMWIKALWEKDSHKILGAQIVGFEGVDKRIDVIATAQRLGAKITDLTKLELSYAPPFGSAKDPVNMLGYVAQNVITGIVKQFFPEDISALPKDGSVSLIDTRTEKEYLRGNIEGFKNIPLHKLRQRLLEIPKDKPVYVHCQSGLRSYIACRILTGNGYNCYNLAGGYKLYETIYK